MLKEFFKNWREEREIDRAYKRTEKRWEREAKKEDKEIDKISRRTEKKNWL